MSVRMKITHAKTASRRSHHRVSSPAVVRTASGVRRRHFMDPVTGTYRGKQILGDITNGSTETSATKKADTPKEKKAKAGSK